MSVALNIVRLVNRTLVFENFDALKGVNVFFRRGSSNFILLAPKDEVEGDPKNYFRIDENGVVSDMDIVEFFVVLDAINSHFDYHDGIYYQTHIKMS